MTRYYGLHYGYRSFVRGNYRPGQMLDAIIIAGLRSWREREGGGDGNPFLFWGEWNFYFQKKQSILFVNYCVPYVGISYSNLLEVVGRWMDICIYLWCLWYICCHRGILIRDFFEFRGRWSIIRIAFWEMHWFDNFFWLIHIIHVLVYDCIVTVFGQWLLLIDNSYSFIDGISTNIFLYLFLKQFTRSGSRVLFLKSGPSGSAAPRLQIEYSQISLKPRYIAGSELNSAYL